MVTALVVGSFDPITLGHEDIVDSALKVADKLHLVIGNNTNKKYFLPLEQRLAILQALYADDPRVVVTHYSGTIAQYCTENKIDIIVKGVRNNIDFEYEKNMAIYNKNKSNVQTFFVISQPTLQHISSTMVRELIRLQGDYQELVSPVVSNLLSDYIKGR